MSATDLNHTQNASSRTSTDRRYRLLPQALGLLGLVSFVFAAIPELDLIATRLFWDPVTGFVLNENGFLVAFRDANRFSPWVVIGIAVALMLPTPLLKRLRYRPAPHKLLFVITFFAAGPGLGVHLLKMLVGRARPRALEEFGGSALFTPPWEITDQCIKNCSFVSGEAASAFALLTLVVFIKPRYTTLYLVTAGIVAAAFSLNRVVFGAHFLSDVIIAWSVMFALAVPIWRLFAENAPQIDALFARRPYLN